MQRLLSSMPKYRWQEMRIISVLDQQQISSVLVARGMQTSAVSQQRDAPTNDPFTQQLQQRTEAELAELLAATQAKKQMQQQQQQGTSASGTNVADNTEDEDEVERPPPAQPDEIGGPRGKEPTRFGDWERRGRCIDF